MSVAICSILAAKISTEQTSELGSHASYMKKLLSIVRTRMQENHLDITLKFTLSALWNLTDESPKTCKGSINLYFFNTAILISYESNHVTASVWSRVHSTCTISSQTDQWFGRPLLLLYNTWHYRARALPSAWTPHAWNDAVRDHHSGLLALADFIRHSSQCEG